MRPRIHGVRLSVAYSTAGNASVLQIVNTTALGTGTHEVQCILQPNIHQNYTNDVSFQSELNENIIELQLWK